MGKPKLDISKMLDSGELKYTTSTDPDTIFSPKRSMTITVTDAPKLERIKPDWSLYKDGESKPKWGKSRG